MQNIEKHKPHENSKEMEDIKEQKEHNILTALIAYQVN